MGYEYKCVTLFTSPEKVYSNKNGAVMDEFDETLNRYAAEGWELHSAVPVSQGPKTLRTNAVTLHLQAMLFIFKRRLPGGRYRGTIED